MTRLYNGSRNAPRKLRFNSVSSGAFLFLFKFTWAITNRACILMLYIRKLKRPQFLRNKIPNQQQMLEGFWQMLIVTRSLLFFYCILNKNVIYRLKKHLDYCKNFVQILRGLNLGEGGSFQKQCSLVNVLRKQSFSSFRFFVCSKTQPRYATHCKKFPALSRIPNQAENIQQFY